MGARLNRVSWRVRWSSYATRPKNRCAIDPESADLDTLTIPCSNSPHAKQGLLTERTRRDVRRVLT